jgi:hypothetical protein
LSGDGLPVGEGDEGSRAPKIGLFRLTADWSASSPVPPLTLSELELRPSLSADRPKRGDDARPTLDRLGDDDRLDDRVATETVLDRVSGDDGGLESSGDDGDGGDDDDETEASAERCAGADDGPPAPAPEEEGGGEAALTLVRRRAGEDMEREEREDEPEGEEEEVLLDRTGDMSPSLLQAACLPSRSCECS